MKNIILTWMSGSGKSTIWKRLAEVMWMNFIDFDELLEEKSGTSVALLLRSKWEADFIIYERDTAMQINVDNTVIALSGSVSLIYEVIEHLKKNWVVIFIDTPINTILERKKNMLTDRIIWYDDDTSLEEIYNRRVPRYQETADYVFKNDTKQNAMWVFTNFLKFFKNLPISQWNDTSSST